MFSLRGGTKEIGVENGNEDAILNPYLRPAVGDKTGANRSLGITHLVSHTCLKRQFATGDRGFSLTGWDCLTE